MHKKQPKFMFIPAMLFVFGLLSASAVALGLERVPHSFSHPIFLEKGAEQARQAYQSVKQRPLNDDEFKAAHIAWVYFKNNTDSHTGWVNSVHEFPSSTLWDQGSYLLGLVSAVRLGIVSKNEFDQRGAKFVKSLHRVKLVNNTLPNKVYNTQNLMMTDYKNNFQKQGIGWSALDIARLIIGLEALKIEHPALSDDIDVLYRRWALEQITHQGDLHGGVVQEDGIKKLQEGRIGYEQYGARGAALIGLDVVNALGARNRVVWRMVGGVRIGTDHRQFANYGAITPVLSEPYILEALEFGLDSESNYLARQVYLAQRNRFEKSGILTAVSEDHITKAPYFMYSSIFANGKEWHVIDEKGHGLKDMRILSTKAAFAWHVIYDDEYTAKIMEKIKPLANEQKGWAAGAYEKDWAINSASVLNTNAVILEALHYKAFGPILWPVRKAVPENAQKAQYLSDTIPSS